MKCELCKKQIKKKDNYCRVTDYKEGRFYVERFYHTICFKDRLIGKTSPQRMAAMALLGRASKLMDKAELRMN